MAVPPFAAETLMVVLVFSTTKYLVFTVKAGAKTAAPSTVKTKGSPIW
jgi:hypothetical protein